jgi:hypothetical protein
MEVKGNPLWALAETIQCDDASNVFACVKQCESTENIHLHKGNDSCDSSNNKEVAEIYAKLQENIKWQYDPNDMQRVVLFVSASFNRTAIVRAILADKAANGVEWSNDYKDALSFAFENGHVESAALLACGDDGQVRSLMDKLSALRYYCLAGDIERAREILASDSPDVTILAALLDACKHGRCDIVTLLTADARFDPSNQGLVGLLLGDACRNGQVEVVSLFLSNLHWQFEFGELGRALQRAVDAGHCDVVDLLVQDRRANRGLGKSFVLEQYCGVGDVKRVKEALDDPELNSPLPGEILDAASVYGRADVVKLLLADPRVDPAADDNAAILSASYNGHVSVVKLLLADSRADPRSPLGSATSGATSGGHASVVKLLLADPRVDPSVGQPVPPLQHASELGHIKIVRMFLADPRVVVTKSCLLTADKQAHGDVIRLLIDKQPCVLQDLFGRATPCKSGGALQSELRQREKASAMTLLLAVERLEVSIRVSDVLREVIAECACFDVIDCDEAGYGTDSFSDGSY